MTRLYRERVPRLAPAVIGALLLSGCAWDGSYFLSSGLGGGGPADVGYRVRFTKPGTYHDACLIHPKMVGTVVVH